MSPIDTLEPSVFETYEQAADRVYSQKVEDYMQSTQQARQQFMTLQTFLAIALLMPSVQCLSDLMILYRLARKKKLQFVAPDNFVILSDEPLLELRSFNFEEQPAKPILVMEYISKGGRKKDRQVNFKKYQDHLRIPFYLIFDPRKQEISLYQLVNERYVQVERGANGRFPIAIPNMRLEAGLVDGWLRFWFNGELVGLMEDALLNEAKERKSRLKAEEDAHKEREGRLAAETRIAKLMVELEQAKRPS